MVLVREATCEDVAVVYKLIVAIAKYHDQVKYVLTSKEELQASGFGLNPKFGVLLAETDGEVAGYVSYTWNYSIWFGSDYMNIDDIYVWERFRGRKIGEALMLKAKSLSKERGVKKIRWEVQKDNDQAIKFYKRLGADFDIKGICSWDIEK